MVETQEETQDEISLAQQEMAPQFAQPSGSKKARAKIETES